MNDLKILSGNFLEYEIPKDKKYLCQYFDTNLRKTFLKYYLVFGEKTNFDKHTGMSCSKSLLSRMERQLNGLIEVYNKAKKSLSEEGMEIVSKIESGKFRLTELQK